MGSRQKRHYPDLSRPRTEWDLNVEIPEEGLRLDRFLTKRVRWKSRTELQGFVDAGYVAVNGALRKSSTRLKVGDQVTIRIPQPENVVDPATIPLSPIYDDGGLLCLDKQPGIVVHPVGRYQLENLLSALHARYRDHDDPSRDRVPHVCHRIDKDTSGVFLVAFDEKLKADVSLQFERREVTKEYLALVHGVPAEPEGEIDAPILYVEDAEPRLRVAEGGLPSVTGYRVEEDLGRCALVRFFPRTGRTHQIRLHSTWLGHPLLCDRNYGREEAIWDADLSTEPPADAGPAARPLLGRCALHSARLTIRHPVHGEPITFEAPLPADIARTVEALR